MEHVLNRTIAGRNAADLGLLITMAALKRSESRGGHYRADYPDEDPKQAMRALVVPGAVDTVRVGG
jgi:aspartate oxidase